MARRRAARELLLKILFQIDVGHLPADEVMTFTFEEVPVSDAQRRYVERQVPEILSHQPELDAIISDLAEGWRLERLANVDKNVLRMALYDLTYNLEATPSSVINDAVEIAKKYSTADSGKFVNGILGAYVRRRDQPD